MSDKKEYNLTPQDFKRVTVSNKEAEKISTKTISFWRDSFRRLTKDKAAVLSLIILALLIAASILLPKPFLNQKDRFGKVFTYGSYPRLVDSSGQEFKKENIAYLPPRIPGVEKLGIFDGTATVEISIFDLIVGELPRSDKFKDLKKPQNREKLKKELDLPYHPYEIVLQDIFEKDGNKIAKIKVKSSGQVKEVPYSSLISEYSKYKQEFFKFVKTSTDAHGNTMVKIKRDMYAMQGVKELYFWFGTDRISLDNYTRLWIGIQISLLIALCSIIFDFSIGITYGTISGFYTGTWIDNLMMRFAEIIGSIPFFVFLFIFISIKKQIVSYLKVAAYYILTGKVFWAILAISAIIFLIIKLPKLIKGYINTSDFVKSLMRFAIFFGIYGLIHLVIYYYLNSKLDISPKGILDNNSASFIIIVLALSITGWIDVSRLVRAQIIKLRDQEFVLASKTLGAGSGRIMRKHLFPNIIGQLVVLATFKIPSAIFSESFLTFLGLGLPNPMTSLGTLVFNGYESIKTQPTLLIIPAFFMSLLMLAINLLANGLRDALDPRMR